jgi:hypothetical protein
MKDTNMNTGAASLSDETILAIEKQVAYLAKSRNDLTIKTVRECIDAAIAAGGAQEAATREEIEHARDRVLAQSKNSLFRSGAKICAAEILSPTKPCTKPPEGWTCSRIEGHEGPCAASPAASNGEQA